tara:strand:- start:406 stop:543 length:138 start_codon:yes stop_codon:yes gene_type:complete
MNNFFMHTHNFPVYNINVTQIRCNELKQDIIIGEYAYNYLKDTTG